MDYIGHERPAEIGSGFDPHGDVDTLAGLGNDTTKIDAGVQFDAGVSSDAAVSLDAAERTFLIGLDEARIVDEVGCEDHCKRHLTQAGPAGSMAPSPIDHHTTSIGAAPASV
jgi:hypothetical protein